jgi:MFS transporter, PAT family, beta-lactamase induction signal transducer AmpG
VTPAEPASASQSAARRGPWLWVPSLYFSQGLPFVVVMSVSVILYKRLGVSNAEIALYTSLLYLPWVVKPLWSPVVDVLRTKRWWIISMQLLVGAGLAGVALSLPAADFIRWTLAFFWMLAFSSATHDIAADGFYMLALSPHDQAWFVGIRSTFYRLAMIAGQGLLVMIAGALETNTGFPDVVVTVNASDSPTALAPFKASKWTPPRGEDSIRIVAQSNELQVGLMPRSADELQQTIDAARSWNAEHGFYRVEKQAEKTSSSKPEWITALEKTIVRHFGPARRVKAPDGLAGEVAVALFALTGPVAPGKTVEVVCERDSGDKSFQVIEGSRFSISDANWEKPFAAVIQIDHRLDEPSSAVFRVRSGNFLLAWTSTFYLVAGIFLAVSAYHAYALPRPARDRNETGGTRQWLSDFIASFLTFFLKRHILATIAFLLLYRFAEAQLVKLASPFLLEMREGGGLALSTGEVGFVYGTVGIVALVLGGILGGWAAARNGLRFWLIWMVLAINLPNLTYVFLSYMQPESFLVVNIAVAIEQFGYGFGFAGYMLYMLYAARGEHETAHYAICTGFMALGMMLPGMFSGWLQELIGYQHFFIWVMLATIPSFLVTALVYFHIDPNFGRREQGA